MAWVRTRHNLWWAEGAFLASLEAAGAVPADAPATAAPDTGDSGEQRGPFDDLTPLQQAVTDALLAATPEPAKPKKRAPRKPKQTGE